jgi:hypothetical protein
MVNVFWIFLKYRIILKSAILKHFFIKIVNKFLPLFALHLTVIAIFGFHPL